jgi:hypothetical protein
MSNDIEAVTKSLPTKGGQDWMDSLLNSTKALKKN